MKKRVFQTVGEVVFWGGESYCIWFVVNKRCDPHEPKQDVRGHKDLCLMHLNKNVFETVYEWSSSEEAKVAV